MATTVERTTAETAPRAAQKHVATAWHQERKTRFALYAVAALVLLAIGAWLVSAAGKRKEAFATTRLERARSAAENGNLPLASRELQQIVTTYRGTDAAREATIALNQVRMVNNQSELAAVGLRDFVNSRPPAKFLAPAYSLLGSALEDAKRPAEAAGAFVKASDAADLDYLKAQYLIEAGRAWRNAGKPEEAIKAYRQVVQKFDKTPSMTEAQVRLAELTNGKM
jgi:outer membrane protein assembly factor BamD (BamD/ComL family)